MNSQTPIDSYCGIRFRGLVHSGLPDCLSQVLDDPEETCNLAGARPVLNAELRTIWEVPVPDGSAYFVHVFRDPRRHMVPRILHMQRLLLAMQVGTFDIVALGREKCGSRRREFFIARKIPHAVSLPAGLGHRYEVIPEARDVPERLASSLARFISDFHRKRIIHGDLKSRHILMAKGDSTSISHAQTEGQKFYLVDLEKTRNLRYLPEILVDLLRVRDLIQLSASCGQLITNQQRIRFLRNYLRRLVVSARRRRTFYLIIRLYSDSGFRQGCTLVQNLLAAALR